MGIEIKNRIVKTGEVELDQVQFNPRNWRVHPLQQQNTLKGALEEIGWLQRVIINLRTSPEWGENQHEETLLDGHLRCQLAAREGQKKVPAEWVDLTPAEEALALASIDPISAMAKADQDKLSDLLNTINGYSTIADKMIEEIITTYKLVDTSQDGTAFDLFTVTVSDPKTVVNVGDVYQLGQHVLICCSPVTDVSLWLPYLSGDMLFAPYASPSTFISKVASVQTIVGTNPLPYICGHIVDRYMEIEGKENVNKK